MFLRRVFMSVIFMIAFSFCCCDVLQMSPLIYVFVVCSVEVLEIILFMMFGRMFLFTTLSGSVFPNFRGVMSCFLVRYCVILACLFSFGTMSSL